MLNIYQIFWEMFKNITYSVRIFCAFNCSFKKMIKIDVLDLVSNFFRTRNNSFNILK